MPKNQSRRGFLKTLGAAVPAGLVLAPMAKAAPTLDLAKLAKEPSQTPTVKLDAAPPDDALVRAPAVMVPRTGEIVHAAESVLNPADWNLWKSRYSRHRIQINRIEYVEFVDGKLYAGPEVTQALIESKPYAEQEIWIDGTEPLSPG